MMMAPEYYTFTGRVGEVIVIPRHVTHVLIDKSRKFVPARTFEGHPNIQELICHDGVDKIEEYAFYRCPSLRRVIMPGVKVIEKWAFERCEALNYIECGKLGRIEDRAFGRCRSLSSINLRSIKIVEWGAFFGCTNLASAKFGKDLKSIRHEAFYDCPSLERIALPLKDGLITAYTIFQRCAKLNHVDLIGGVYETIATLLLEEWKNDMNEEIENISQILPHAPAGDTSPGEKAHAIRTWIRSVLRKYTHYKAKHRRYLNVAASTLQPALPNDIVFKNVLPFLELPSHTFEGEE